MLDVQGAFADFGMKMSEVSDSIRRFQWAMNRSYKVDDIIKWDTDETLRTVTRKAP